MFSHFLGWKFALAGFTVSTKSVDLFSKLFVSVHRSNAADVKGVLALDSNSRETWAKKWRLAGKKGRVKVFRRW